MIYYLRKHYEKNIEQREAVIVFYNSMSAKKQAHGARSSTKPILNK